ncbi:670_t:CDS:2, partial [Paraglomus occultum]
KRDNSTDTVTATVDAQNKDAFEELFIINRARYFRHYFAHEKLSRGVSDRFITFLQTVYSLKPVFAQSAADAFEEFVQERTRENLIKFLRQIAFRVLPYADIGSYPPDLLLQDYSDEVARYIQELPNKASSSNNQSRSSPETKAASST